MPHERASCPIYLGPIQKKEKINIKKKFITLKTLVK